MPPIASFRDLLVWQKAMDLAVDIYRVTKRIPRQEQPVLGHQLRKSAVSIPSNIAEGHSRQSTAYYIQHLRTAHGSSAELETQIELARRIGITPEPDAQHLITRTQEICRMLNGLIAALQRRKDLLPPP